MTIQTAKMLVSIQADIADVKKFVEAGKQIEDTNEKTKSSSAEAGEVLDDLFSSFTGISIASLGTTAGIAAVAAGLINMTNAAGESELATVRLDAVYRATNGAVGLTRESLDDLANSMMYATGADDEMLAGAEAILLTFDKIQGDIFPRTMKAAANLAAVMGGDMVGAVEMLGKALSVPETGFALLKRAGVIFTEQQETMIKTMAEAGDAAGAQAAMLDVLEKKMGGVANAMGNTYAGEVKKLQTSFENLKETLGGGLLPELTKILTGWDYILNWQGKVSAATTEHSMAILKTTDSYEAYIKQIWDYLDAAGAVEASDKHYLRNYGEMDKLILKYGAWTRERFDKERAQVALSVEKSAKLKYEGEAMTFAQKRLDEYLALAAKAPEIVAAQTSALSKQAGEWLNLAQSIGGVTRAQVGQSAIDFLREEMAGKSPQEQAQMQEMINKTALDFGIITKQEAEWATARQKLKEAYDQGVINWKEVPEAFDMARKQIETFGKVDMGAIFSGLIENAGTSGRKLGDVEASIKRLINLDGTEVTFYVDVVTTGAFPSSNPGVNPTTIGISGKDERHGSSSSSSKSGSSGGSATNTGANKGPGFAGGGRTSGDVSGGGVKVYGPIHIQAAAGDDLGGILRRLKR
jgi:hypothetical protein